MAVIAPCFPIPRFRKKFRKLPSRQLPEINTKYSGYYIILLLVVVATGRSPATFILEVNKIYNIKNINVGTAG